MVALAHPLFELKNDDGAVNTSTSPKVKYYYDTTTNGSSNVYDDGLRSWYARYPLESSVKGELQYFGTINDRLSRPKYQQLWGGSFSSSLHWATSNYQYNGTGRLVETYTSSRNTGSPAPPSKFVAKLKKYSSTGNYSRLDRFGRTTSQRWDKWNGTAIDQFNYTYDYASNRLTRNNPINNTYDQTFTYDGLQRLKSVDEHWRRWGTPILKSGKLNPLSAYTTTSYRFF